MLNYLHKFIEVYNEKAATLLELFSKHTKWCWEAPQQKAFETLQQDISNPLVLRVLILTQQNLSRCLLINLRVEQEQPFYQKTCSLCSHPMH